MITISLVKQAQQQVALHLTQGAIAIDATVGNGHDSLFLAQQVGATGQVYGFDIQAAAITATYDKAVQAQLATRLTLCQACHSQMAAYIPIRWHGYVQAVMFNLGYLPGGNKQVITQADSTLAALLVACQLLAPNGVLTVLAYPGHLGGDVETIAVTAWLRQLEKTAFSVDEIASPIDKPYAPRLFVVHKNLI
jgi:predicted methyltransferase